MVLSPEKVDNNLSPSNDPHRPESKLPLAISFIIIVVILGILFIYQVLKPSSPKSIQNAITSNSNQATQSNSSGRATTATGSVASDQQIDQDLQSVEKDLNSLGNEAAAVDQGFNDQQGDLSE
ncbi:MAG: hypothetical protein M1150_01055 [Patescibacteria group bacterium]|nr:hypothetical protein [Patescibacteria group bacterium]